MAYRKTRSRESITQARLQELVAYHPETGLFRWRVGGRGGSRKGAVAGCVSDPRGVVVLRLDYQLYLAHRLAWLWVTGEWPVEEIDHRDGDPSNNIWGNLRAATRAEQLQNTKDRASSSGYRGVSRFRDKWQAGIRVGGKSIHLGHFADPAKAHAAYLAAKAKLHPFQPVPRDAGGLGGTPPE